MADETAIEEAIPGFGPGLEIHSLTGESQGRLGADFFHVVRVDVVGQPVAGQFLFTFSDRNGKLLVPAQQPPVAVKHEEHARKVVDDGFGHRLFLQQRRFRPFALGDVGDHGNMASRRFSRSPLRHHREVHPDDGAVGAQHAFVHLVEPDTAFSEPLQVLQVLFKIIGVGNALEIPFQHLAARVSVDFARFGVDLQEPPGVGVNPRDSQRCLLIERPEPCLTFSQVRLRLFALTNVAHDRLKTGLPLKFQPVQRHFRIKWRAVFAMVLPIESLVTPAERTVDVFPPFLS